MGMVKDSLLLAAGGAIGVVAGIMLCDKLQEDVQDEMNVRGVGTLGAGNLAIIVDKVRDKALEAMSQAETDEERERVYVECHDAIQKMQAMLTERGESMLRQVQERAELSAEVTEDVKNAHSKHIKTTIEQLTEELDDILKAIAPNELAHVR